MGKDKQHNPKAGKDQKRGTHPKDPHQTRKNPHGPDDHIQPKPNK